MLRAVALAVVLTALAPGVARGAPSWRWPVRGRIVRAFSVSRADPFADGQHRGIAVAAAPGVGVVAACGGRVTFAGPVGRAGPTLSVRCGALRATYEGLATIRVHAGDLVMPGETVATLGSHGVLRLGARVERRRRSYVDPAALLRDLPQPPTPLGRAPRGAGPPRPIAVPVAVKATPRPRPRRPLPGRAPLLAWLGLGVLGAALPVSSLWRRGLRRRSAPSFRSWALRQLR